MNEDTPRPLAHQIKAWRKHLGMTQEQVRENSRRLTKDGRPMAAASVSDWERGVRQPHLETLMVLCAIFGISLDELIYGEPNNNKAPHKLPQAERVKEYLRFALEALEDAKAEAPESVRDKIVEAQAYLRQVAGSIFG